MICNRVNCSKDAAWQVGFGLQAAHSDVTVHAQIGLYLCTEHKAEVTLEELVTDDWWDRICADFARLGKALPARRKTKLEWKPLA